MKQISVEEESWRHYSSRLHSIFQSYSNNTVFLDIFITEKSRKLRNKSMGMVNSIQLERISNSANGVGKSDYLCGKKKAGLKSQHISDERLNIRAEILSLWDQMQRSFFLMALVLVILSLSPHWKCRWQNHGEVREVASKWRTSTLWRDGQLWEEQMLANCTRDRRFIPEIPTDCKIFVLIKQMTKDSCSHLSKEIGDSSRCVKIVQCH